ncbi:hypothetical protein 162286290 [Organic Lake phycodnavirus]|jgi:flagellar biosynthesis regulator FlaF|nr:hypothetical protein 162286290 [Organic Lake phycodnavirus]
MLILLCILVVVMLARNNKKEHFWNRAKKWAKKREEEAKKWAKKLRKDIKNCDNYRRNVNSWRRQREDWRRKKNAVRSGSKIYFKNNHVYSEFKDDLNTLEKYINENNELNERLRNDLVKISIMQKNNASIIDNLENENHSLNECKVNYQTTLNDKQVLD